MMGPLPVSSDAATDARIAVLSDALRGVCADVNVPYLEVFPRTTGCRAWSQEAALGDGTHPNRGGYEALAGIVAEWRGWLSWMENDGRVA